jgi:photosystem II stability/assembly factor-like uncharacterized protein
MNKLRLISFCVFVALTTNTFAQWQKAKGKYADSNVTNFVVLENKILAGTSYNGIIISEDDGKTWDKNIPLKYPLTWLHNFDGLLIGFFGHEHTYIIYSRNQGETWEEVSTDTLFHNISKFIYSLTYHNKEIYITNGKGIFKTADWGESWKLVNNKFGYQSKIISFDEYLYASNQKIGMWFSKDNGKTWIKDETNLTTFSQLELYHNKLISDNGGYFMILSKPGGKWNLALNPDLKLLGWLYPFCCNSYISSGLFIIFSDDNIIQLPKIEVPGVYNISLANAITHKNGVITASIINHHIWYIKFKLKLEY